MRYITNVNAPATQRDCTTEEKLGDDVARDNWWEQAACRGVNPDVFFPEESGVTTDRIYDQGRQFCNDCPVARNCLEEAMSYEAEEWRRFGLWGGLSPRQREALSQKRAGTR